MAKRAPIENPPPAALGSFDGYPVTDMAIAIRNAGDGLADALEIAPRKHNTGDETFFVLRCFTGPIDHVPLTDQGKKAGGKEMAEFVSYQRVEDQMTVQAIEVDSGQVSEWLQASASEATRRREAKAKEEQLAAEEAAGVMRLVPDEDDDGEDE